MQNVIDRVALYADIDTRRALGVYKKVKVPTIKLQPPVLWRYWPAQQKAIYFCAYPWDYEFEVHQGLIHDGQNWSYTEDSSVRSRLKNKYHEQNGLDPEIKFSFACEPTFCS